MTSEPHLEQRPAQPYAAICVRVTMAQIAPVCPPLMGEVFAWLAERGIAPAGPPFFRYLVIDMAHELEIEVGVPLAEPLQVSDDRVRGGVFPAGWYAVSVHTGPYPELVAATGQLLAWGEANGITWDATPDQREWTARIEFYLSDPAEEADPARCRTELAFRVRR